MQCPFCKDEYDNKNFDNAVNHAIIATNETGHTHIHAPFDNAAIICDFIEKMIVEAEKNGIIYKHRL